MDIGGREPSPIVEHPVNLAGVAPGKATRSASGSTLPTYELDPATQQLLEENEGMLYEISSLTRDLQATRGDVAKLQAALAAKERELEALREKLGDANVHARDASGRVINYKTECERLTLDNRRLKEEYDKVYDELNKQAEMIRSDMSEMQTGSARSNASAQVEQLHREMQSFCTTVDCIVNSLRRCIVVGVKDRDRVLESTQKELNEIQRMTDTLHRRSVADEGRIQDLMAAFRKAGSLLSPGDLAIVVRCMIAQSLEAGLTATEGNLRAIQFLIADDMESSSNSDASRTRGGDNKRVNGAVKSAVLHKMRKPSK
ncbi:hypothetical protein DQ04_05971040 [Trypanosoma grayi]|uniref:hypothetical protein n=1 Tax=Trypanosoma grayi TaxID=71804 RepID=UPI0004F43B73|nr:hypothetical protein DQ04_05971040 [Trypanosoma grayi]KEG09023.1 hypothetical protein DQ04_05971040 [Trypanosoma grayi]